MPSLSTTVSQLSSYRLPSTVYRPQEETMPDRRFRVGVQVRPQHTTYASMRDAWRRIEDLGVETLWNWDHFFPTGGDPQGNHFECWTLLAAMAEVTKRVE